VGTTTSIQDAKASYAQRKAVGDEAFRKAVDQALFGVSARARSRDGARNAC